MKVRTIMTRNVVSAAPDTSVLEVASLLVHHRISAVPVADGASVIGMVSEADLLHRHELGTQRNPDTLPWWRRILSGEDAVESYVQAHATKVRDVMSMPVITVAESMTVGDLAVLLESNAIRRAPVLRDGRMVGIVSRADFVRALVAQARVQRREHARSDESIRRELLAELESQGWWRSRPCDVTVSDGIVHFAGRLESLQDKVATRVAAENIPGVRGIEDRRRPSIPAGGYL
jgi:CBS domain-containing protein